MRWICWHNLNNNIHFSSWMVTIFLLSLVYNWGVLFRILRQYHLSGRVVIEIHSICAMSGVTARLHKHVQRLKRIFVWNVKVIFQFLHCSSGHLVDRRVYVIGPFIRSLPPFPLNTQGSHFFLWQNFLTFPVFFSFSLLLNTFNGFYSIFFMYDLHLLLDNCITSLLALKYYLYNNPEVRILTLLSLKIPSWNANNSKLNNF